MRDLKILDCTLRDGGYYNNWDFHNFVSAYLDAVSASNIDIEIGLRSLLKDSYKGPYAFSSEGFLRSLPLPQNVELSVMINASELLDVNTIEESLSYLFPVTAYDSCLSLVRVACTIDHLPYVPLISRWLKSHNYRVGFNLMRSSECSHSEILSFANTAVNSFADVFYIADSLGSFTKESLANTLQNLLTLDSTISLGIHAHNNQFLALQNTIDAYQSGFSYLDATIMGMGRGPGNAFTENLIAEITTLLPDSKYNLLPLLLFLDNHMLSLMDEFKWGTNVFYYLAGKYSIHPSYIQNMLSDNRFDTVDVYSVINELKDSPSSSTYNPSIPKIFTQPESFTFEYSSSVIETIQPDSNILLLGTGNSVHDFHQYIIEYIQKYKPIVLALNVLQAIPPEYIDYRVCCNQVRFLADAHKYRRDSAKLIVPQEFLSIPSICSIDQSLLFHYGIKYELDTFSFSSNSCIIPQPLSLAYALAICSATKAKFVNLAGFDGYPSGDNRNIESQDIFNLYSSNQSTPPFHCLTPTRYNIPQTSIYAYLD